MILSVATINLFYFGLLGKMHQGEEFDDNNNNDVLSGLVLCYILTFRIQERLPKLK